MNLPSRLTAALLSLSLLAGCGGAGRSAPPPAASNPEPVTLLVAAAASLRACFEEELIPLFRESHPHIAVEGTYDSSGKLQAQIEEGLAADLFLSAAVKQMNDLLDQALIDPDSVVPLLENKIVLVEPAGMPSGIGSFEEIASAGSIALGDPDSVPAGQYAREALTSLGVWEEIRGGVSLGTNVTEVLHWVAEGSAEVGVVYATDAASTDRVRVIAEAPEGSLAAPVVYPAGRVSAGAHPEEARLLLDFLRGPEALAVFASYGFSPCQ